MSQIQLFNFYNTLRALDQKDQQIAEYVWIDGTGIGLRSKSKTLSSKVTSLSQVPEWNYDGSSTYQTSTHNSEVILKPVALFQDPFRGGDNIIVFCDAYIWADENFTHKKPANTNFRHFATQIFDAVKDQHPWFGIE